MTRKKSDGGETVVSIGIKLAILSLCGDISYDNKVIKEIYL